MSTEDFRNEKDGRKKNNNTPLPAYIEELGKLPPGAIISEKGMAQFFNRCVESVKRAVRRGELPPPTPLFNGKVWTAGVVLKHIESRLESAAKGKKKDIQAFKKHLP